VSTLVGAQRGGTPLWAPREVCDVSDMYRRLAVIDARLQGASLQQHQWPRIELPGLDSESPIADALRTLASVVEPVKEYHRLDLQPDCTQSTPLNELADWSRFDSRAAREFNASVAQWLSAPGELDAKMATALARQLERWSNAGELAAQAPASATPVAQGRTEMARSLAAICRIGREAIQALMSGRTVADDWRLTAGAILDHAEQPNAAAVEFPFLPSLQQLVTTAAKLLRTHQAQ
jgi:hexosaminidase